MDNAIRQIQALTGDLAGYVDALRVEAGEIFDKSTQLLPTIAQLAEVEQTLADRKAELAVVETRLASAKAGNARLLEILQRV